MLSYIFRRLLLMIPTLFGVMAVTFLVIQFVPGGPVERMVSLLEKGHQSGGGEVAASASAGRYRGAAGLDPEQIDQLRRLYGFDRPPMERFFLMMWNYLRFDFGDSYYYHRSVIDLVMEKMPVSISLGLWTFFLTYLVSIPLGIRKAVRHQTRFDSWTSTVILAGYSIPGFVLGILLIVLFGGGSFWNLFPMRGLVSDHWQELSLMGKILDYLWHMVLPITASVVGSFAVMTMLTKNSFLEEISRQYVLTARAKGLGENAVLYRHVFRNAMIPLVTGFPGSFVSAFFSGSLLIETIFSLDGLGLLGYESVINRDYPVVMASLYFFTLLGLLTKLLTDIVYVMVDPRITFDKAK
ncbi:MAG: microcin C ABC transporter permease YejB [Magnetococcales bacterium]|nr:microcin C ABC transporter permease YejB [Magnetococcales bacterium]MBF0149700.1 microcin C ABC transporter permease YejB [Magnetococcales bacterium]MBF0174069.1 microcin C ABC transporter permease YejB [Magnetococcales bacterium]MBF0346666.1 microcin C ABC transporter permease YejB [Magnetococcales bacterium]MBF0630749.1 microcin C ABC transporter permease YejB [Magnetococcales bacterium]